MPTVTQILHLLQIEPQLSRIAKLYDGSNRVVAEYKTVPNPTPGTTECLKRSYIYDASSNVIGYQVKTDIWTQNLENLVSPPITDIQLSNLTIVTGLPAGTKVADITVVGGVAPLVVSLSSNPGNLFRVDNNADLVLNAPSSSGIYPITVQVTDDDGKIASQGFNIVVSAFSNTKSMQFDGVDEIINCGTNADIQFDKTSPFSVSGWVKFGTITSSISLIGNFGAITAPRGWRVMTGVSGTYVIGFQLSNSSVDQLLVYTTETFTDGLWHSFVVTYNGSGLASGVKIYVDGTERATSVFVDALSLSTVVSNNLTIAGTGDIVPKQAFNGNLDELGVWNKVLSAAEAAAIHGSGQPSDLLSHSASADLLHYYRMGDDDLFPSVPDKKGANNGTAINMEALDVKADVP